MHRIALLVFAAVATTGCSLLVGGEDLAANHRDTVFSPADPSEPAADAGGEVTNQTGDAGDAGCAPGACGPAQIFTAPPDGVARDWPIAVRGGRVTFAYASKNGAEIEGHIATIGSDGGAVTSNARGAYLATRLFVDDKYVYATTDGTTSTIAYVRRIDRGTACDACITQGVAMEMAGPVVFNGADIVWSMKVGRYVRAVPIAAGTAHYPAALPSAPIEMALDPLDGTAFVLEENVAGTPLGAVQRYRRGASALEDFVKTASPKDLAVDGTNVYVATNAGVLMAYAKTTGTMRTLATQLSGVQHIALDGPNIYVTRGAGTSGTIEAVRTDGASNPKTLTTTKTSPRGIAVDATGVYWTDTAGSVWKVTK